MGFMAFRASLGLGFYGLGLHWDVAARTPQNEPFFLNL